MKYDEKALFSKEVIEYIHGNEHIDSYVLALKKSPFPETPMSVIAQQIQGRRVAAKKFPFLLKFDQFRFPKKESLEQASSEITARFKSELVEGESFVDLTGGMGIDTLLLGNKFNNCVYVEPNVDLYNSTRCNFNYLGFHRCITFNKNCEDFLALNSAQYDWVYLDPSRRIEGSRRTSIHNYAPNIVALQDQVTKMAGNILVKLSPMQDISECLTALKDVHQIWVLSIQNEVKELLLHIKPQTITAPTISAIDISSGEKAEYSHPFYDRQCEIDIGTVQKYLYQPGAAVVKAELNNKYANLHSLEKLNANTQLYTSENLNADFFGRIFTIQEQIQLTQTNIVKALPELKANVICKNFPLSPQELKRKYKLKDGGDHYLIAYTDLEERPVAVICKRIK